MPNATRLKGGILFVLALALLPGRAPALDALQLATTVPDLERRGNWRDTLEELTALGIPQSWQLLGPLSSEAGRVFEHQLDPEKSDDWSVPLTDNLGRVFKITVWNKPKDDDGCYVDFDESFPTPPAVPLAFAECEINAPADGPAILWFESAGRAVVYLNNRQVLGAPNPDARKGGSSVEGMGYSGKKSRYEGQYNVLYPIAVELKRGRNFLKIKLQKERHQSLKGWGFFARLERSDLDWQRQLLEKLKQLYPSESEGQAGASLELTIARILERSGDSANAVKAYRGVVERFSKLADASEDAGDSLKRIADHTVGLDSPMQAWTAASARFRTALDIGRTFDADLEMRTFLAHYPFGDEAGLALCNRGGLRLDYAWEESARPFYERAAREFSGSDSVRKLSVKGLEFAKFFKPQRGQADISREAENAFGAIVRQVQDGNQVDRAAGLKALGELLSAQPDALIRAGGGELFPRYASLTQTAREFLKSLGEADRKLFREALARAAQPRFERAALVRDPALLEDVARKFPGTAAAAQALNIAGNVYLDRGQNEHAAQIFGGLRAEFAGSGVLNDAVIALKETHALAEVAKAAPSAGSGTDTFGGNTRRSGAECVDPPRFGAVEWQRPMEPSRALIRAKENWPEDRFFSHLESFPIISGERVFVSSRQQLQAFALNGGNELWNKRWENPGVVVSDGFGGFPQSLPSIADGRIFLRAYSNERRSVLRCYSAENGALVWDTDQHPDLKTTYFSSEPLVAYDRVFAIFFEITDAETSRYGMLALNARSGAIEWKRYFGSGVSGVQLAERIRETRFTQVQYRVTLQMGPPAAENGIVYSPTGLGSLAALNAYSGEILWISAYPRLRAGNLYTGNSGIENFLPRMLKCLARGPSAPVLSGGVVALAPKDSAGVLAFDQSSGALLWSRELLDARFIAGVCGDNLLTADDTVTALNLKSGMIAWSYSSAGKRLLAQPGYCGGVLYLPMEDSLRRVDARDGKLLDERPWDKNHGVMPGNFVVTPGHIVGVNGVSLISIGGTK